MPTVTVDPSGALALLGDAKKQLPYALSLAVRSVGLAVQTAERDHLAHVFKLRRPDFIAKQGVKVQQFPTKAKPSMVIGPDDKAEFLAKFEAGGTRLPTGGRASLAIPVGIRRNKVDIVTRANFVRPLVDRAAKRAEATPGGVGKVFIVKFGERVVHGGKVLAPGVYQRVGGTRNPRLKLLYLLKPKVQVKAVLELFKTADRVVGERWASAVEEAVAKALATAR